MKETMLNEPIRALIVEDDPESAEAMHIMLTKRGVTTTLFHKAEEALEHFAPDRFDVAVADIRLDGMSGVEFLGRIRQQWVDFPVILLTGYDGIDSAIQAVRLGAQDYIIKPLNAIEDLTRPMEKAVRTHRLSIRNRTLEAELRQSETRFRSILENSVDIVFELNLSTRRFDYVSPSAQALLGCPGAESDPPHLDRLLERIHPDDITRVRDRLDSLPSFAADRKPAPLECRVRREGQEDVWLSITQQPVFGPTGQPSAIVGNARDITRSRQLADREQKLQERLSRAQRMESLSVLAGGVAHDLNNVMQSLIGLPEALLISLDHSLPSIEEWRRDLTAMRNSAGKALEIFRDLLTLSRSGSYPMKQLDLNLALGNYLDSADFATLRQSSPAVRLVTSLAHTLPPMQGSTVQLQRTIMNLVVNAQDAMPHSGTLTIRTRRVSLRQKLVAYEIIEPGEYVVLEVGDTGSGIHPDHLGRIFEPFFTSKEPGKRSGTGLGLAVVHGVVKDHHGFIDVTSDPGKGAVFALYFPATAPVASMAAARAGSAPAADRNGAILVVDDDETHRAMAAKIIARLGYDVHAASSGREAIRQVQATVDQNGNGFDLVLIDMCMEDDFDGLDTYRGIVQCRSEQRCILMSGFADRDRVRHAQRLGAGQFLSKPYTLEELSAAIQMEMAAAPDGSPPKGHP